MRLWRGRLKTKQWTSNARHRQLVFTWGNGSEEIKEASDNAGQCLIQMGGRRWEGCERCLSMEFLRKVEMNVPNIVNG